MGVPFLTLFDGIESSRRHCQSLDGIIVGDLLLCHLFLGVYNGLNLMTFFFHYEEWEWYFYPNILLFVLPT